MQRNRAAIPVGYSAAVAQLHDKRPRSRVEGGAGGHADDGVAGVALRINHTVGELVVGDQSQGAIGGGDRGVEQNAAAGLESQGTAVAAGTDGDRGVYGDVVA